MITSNHTEALVTMQSQHQDNYQPDQSYVTVSSLFSRVQSSETLDLASQSKSREVQIVPPSLRPRVKSEADKDELMRRSKALSVVDELASASVKSLGTANSTMTFGSVPLVQYDVSCNKQRLEYKYNHKNIETKRFLVEETNDFSTHMLALSLLVVHDSHRSGQHNMPELTARKEVASPHLNLVHLDIEAGGDATALVQTTVQIHNHLSRTVIINDGDFTNVSYSSLFLPIAHPSSACTEGTSEAPSSKDEREPDAYHASQRW